MDRELVRDIVGFIEANVILFNVVRLNLLLIIFATLGVENAEIAE